MNISPFNPKKDRFRVATMLARVLRLGFITRSLAALLSILVMAWFAGVASAQGTIPLRLVVPYGAGSPPDVHARIFAEHLKGVLHQSVVVINKPGAAGIIGAQEILASPKDGLTLLWAASSLFGLNPYVFRKVPYQLEQFEPVSNVVDVCWTIYSRQKLGVKSLPELVKIMKESPGKVNFATPGVVSQMSLTWERFIKDAGVTGTNIVYKTTSEARISLLGNHSDVTVSVLSAADLDAFRAGTLMPLAVTCQKRVPQLPSVPTMADAGFPNASFSGSYQLFFAKGVAPSAIENIASASERIKRDKGYLEQLDGLMATPAVQSSPAEFRTWLDADRALWSRLAKDANLMIEN